MSAPWKDITTWCQGDVDRTPRSWALQLAWLRVVVTRHIHYPGCWVLTSHEIGVSNQILSSDDIDAAKAEALEVVKRRILLVEQALARLLPP